MEDEVGKISGTLYWGRNAIDGEIDESLVDGYDVWLVDSCGEQYLHVTRVTKLNWIQENGCCDPAAYNYTFGILDMPQESMLIMLPCCHVCDTYSCFSSGTYELHDYALQGRLLGFQLDNSETIAATRINLAFQAEDQLLAGSLIPIQERTTTTTTSSRSSSTTTATSSAARTASFQCLVCFLFLVDWLRDD